MTSIDTKEFITLWEKFSQCNRAYGYGKRNEVIFIRQSYDHGF